MFVLVAKNASISLEICEFTREFVKSCLIRRIIETKRAIVEYLSKEILYHSRQRHLFISNTAKLELR